MFETWFILAVLSAFGSGIGNFYNKVAVQKNYNKELFIIYGVILATIIAFALCLLFEDPTTTPLFVLCLSFVGGLLATAGILGKMESMKHIDVTIFMPLFKTISPVIVILIGIVVFGEWFTWYEALGIVISLTIPLLLISRLEHARQKNLTRGLIYTLGTSFLAAITVVVHKYSTDLSANTLTLTTVINFGIACGAIGLFVWKNRTKNITNMFIQDTTLPLIVDSVLRGLIMLGGFICLLYALTLGGPLGIIYTINSLYVVIPIVLSIIIYKEHWNTRKVVAIVLSVIALGFFG